MNTFDLYGVSGLLLFVFKGGVVLSLAALGALALRNASAAVRHCVWFLGMAGVLALPMVDALTPRWMVAVPTRVARVLPSDVVDRLPSADLQTSRSSIASVSTRFDGGHGLSVDEAPLADAPFTASIMERPRSVPSIDPSTAGAPPHSAIPRSETTPWAGWSFPRLMTIALGVWALGSALLLLTFGVGLVTLARLGRRSVAFPDGPVPKMARTLALEMGMRGAVPVLQGARGAMPMSWGLLRRVILLPEDADTWDEARLVAVLRHELAHVRRRDCLTQAVAEVSLALHWPNPLAWLAARRLRVEREHACDDAVVLAGARPSEYALALMELARSSPPLPTRVRVAAAMARPVHLRGRLRAILDEGRVRKGSPLANAAAAVTAVALVIAVAAFTPAAGTDPSEEPVTILGSSNVAAVPGTPPPTDAPFAEASPPIPIETSDDLAIVTLPVLVHPDPTTIAMDLPPVDERGQIRGRITDATTGEPLRDARVQRIGSEVVGISSANGSYALIDIPAGTYEIRVELVGYATQTRQVALTQEAVLETDFALVPAANLQELFELELQRLREQYNTSNRDRPEVVITGTAGSAARIRLRDRQIFLDQTALPIIYIDGVRVGQTLDSIDSDQIERVEVIKGAAAVARFGPEAEVGVILIYLKRPPGVEQQVRTHPNPTTREALDALVAEGVGLDPTEPRPVIHMDGVVLKREAVPQVIGSIEPSDIERVEVIAREAAAAWYGVHAQAIRIFLKTEAARAGAVMRIALLDAAQGGGARTIVFVDGECQEGSAGRDALARANPDDIERIEFIKERSLVPLFNPALSSPVVTAPRNAQRVNGCEVPLKELRGEAMATGGAVLVFLKR